MSGNRPPFDGYSRGSDETERFAAVDDPSPWYLKRWALALWGLAVAILLAVIIWGLAVLARGNGDEAPAPTPTHPPTTTSSATTPSTITTTAPTTTTDETSPQPTATWTPQHPRRHHWHGNLPPIPPVPHF